MSWAALDPAIRSIAEEHLTDKQLATWKLELAGWGLRKIGAHQAISRQAVRDRLDLAHLELSKHGITQDASGNYHHTERAA